MPNSNTAAIVTALEAVVEAGAPGDRLPSVRELMARHRAGPATVQQAIATLAARGLVEARPGRGTFVAARAAAPAAPIRRGRRSRWARGRSTPTRWRRCCARRRRTRSCSPPATCPADLQPTAALGAALARAARRPGAWDRVPLEGIAGLRSLLRGGGRRGARRRADLPRRAGGARGVPARAGGAGRAGGRRGADLPRRARPRPARRGSSRSRCRPTSAASGPTCSPTRSSARARGSSTCSRSTPTRTGRRSRAERRAAVLDGGARGERVPDRGRRVPRPALRPGAAAAVRARTPTATSCRSARSPSRRRPGCGSAPSSRAGRRSRGCAPRGSSRTSTSPGPLQEAALELVGTPAWRAHLRRLRRVLRERRDALAAAWGGAGPAARRAG